MELHDIAQRLESKGISAKPIGKDCLEFQCRQSALTAFEELSKLKLSMSLVRLATWEPSVAKYFIEFRGHHEN
jgi:hypothetical protein